jgi:lipoprotein-anchoring transpeptidase ErfK/SrfK
MGKLHTRYDWTRGCIAVTNEEIDEIWSMVPNGTRVEIEP